MDERDVDDGSRSGWMELLPLDRFNAFSDGVFAIAITLLALELTVPVASGRLLADLVEQWPEFLGYSISFAFIGGMWLTHARMTRLMKLGDAAVFGINLLVLLFIGVLPFTTSLMVRNLSGPDTEVAVLVYGINVLIASLLLSFLLVYIARDRRLVVDDVADETLAAIARRRWAAIGIEVVAIACALVVPLVAVALYLLATLLMLTAPLVRLRRSRGNTQAPTTWPDALSGHPIGGAWQGLAEGRRRSMTFGQGMETVVEGFELVGVAILALGALAAIVRGAIAYARGERQGLYKRVRGEVGRAILLGLEVLIIADIVLTVTIDQTIESAVTLGIIVLVRTFLSFSLEIEMDGTVPWRRARSRATDGSLTSARSGRCSADRRNTRPRPPTARRGRTHDESRASGGFRRWQRRRHQQRPTPRHGPPSHLLGTPGRLGRGWTHRSGSTRAGPLASACPGPATPPSSHGRAATPSPSSTSRRRTACPTSSRCATRAWPSRPSPTTAARPR